MDCITPGFLVHLQLPMLAQTHVHRIGDAIQPSHPLSSPLPPTLNLSQHQGLFHCVGSSHQVAKVLEFQLQHQSFQDWNQDRFPLGWIGWMSLQSKRLSRVFSNTTVQKHKFLTLSVQSVQFSCSVMSDSWCPHGLPHTRLPYLSPTPGAYSNSWPSHWWCHPTISSSVIPFSSHLEPFPALGSFQMSQHFASGS